jgi:hypothetical protein
MSKKNIVIILLIILIGIIFLYQNSYVFKSVDTIIDNTEYYNNPFIIFKLQKNETGRIDTQKIDTILISETENFYVVEDDKHQIELKKDNYNIGIFSVQLSYDKKFMAINITFHTGSYTTIINLETWEYWSIGEDDFEDVGNLKWNPNDNKMIVLIGSIMKVTPVLYNAETREIEKYLYGEDINIIEIRIANDGSFVDFVEENYDYGEEKYIIYRSYIDKEKVEELGKITKDKMIDWSLKWKR